MKLFYCIIIMGAISLRAQNTNQFLKWDSNKILLQSGSAQTNAKCEFKFTNTGNKIVNIMQIGTSCSCTIATLDSRTILPNKTASVQVVFNYGSHSGFNQRYIHLLTDEPGSQIYQLELDVNIPYLVTPDKNEIIWSASDINTAKSFVIKSSECFENISNDILVQSCSTNFTVNSFVKIGDNHYAVGVKSLTHHPTKEETPFFVKIIYKNGAIRTQSILLRAIVR